ncbi:MAG: hypothetical protein CFH41_02375 [Alphaproteobacteria bacterium MarineAlpha11_Bin1]|nr:MAG: hypothetical protein CFH41_02375 [Alphaproteobacteria bacterium MarineAlpha11_Bin1]
MFLIYEILASAPGVSDWSFVTLCLISFLTSAVSAAFGLGGGAALVAVMASVMPSISIIPIHAVVQVGSNFFRAIIMWRHILFTWMPSFVLGTLIGAFLGGQVVFSLPKYILQAIIGFFVLYAVWAPKMRAFEPTGLRLGMVGAMASFATMFAGATGPLIAPFIKASTKHRMMTVATHAAFMSWQHGVKILTFGFLGFAFLPYLPLMLLMIVFGLIGTWSGKFILSWMAEDVFRWGFNLLLTALAIHLLVEAAQELTA